MFEAGKHTKKAPATRSKRFFTFVLELAVAVLLAWLITLAVRPTIVLETSMMPNFEPHDYLFINRLAYNGELSPARGDVIVFRSDLTTEDGRKKLLIKRVIGVGGDVIEVRDGQVYVNGIADDQSYTKDGSTSGSTGPDIVPEGSVYVLGDNRLVSRDSRDPAIGMVSEDRIVGKVFFRIFHFDRFGKIENTYEAS